MLAVLPDKRINPITKNKKRCLIFLLLISNNHESTGADSGTMQARTIANVRLPVDTLRRCAC